MKLNEVDLTTVTGLINGWSLTAVGPRWADAARFSICWSGRSGSACAVISRGAGTGRQSQACRGRAGAAALSIYTDNQI